MMFPFRRISKVSLVLARKLLMTTPKPLPTLNEDRQSELVNNLSHWALGNGLTMYPTNFELHNTGYAPVTLFPTPFPRKQFEKALAVQEDFNELYAQVVKNQEWLGPILEDLSQFDKDFTGKLWETYKEAKTIGIVQPVSLGLFRSDYMVDTLSASSFDGVNGKIKQIEFNTVSVSFGGLSPKVAQLHRYLNENGNYHNEGKLHFEDDELPNSESTASLANGLAKAAAYYNSTESTDSSVVLVVVQDNERNVFDQRALEFDLLKRHKVRSIRLRMEDISASTDIDEKTKRVRLRATGEEVSVIYYRSAYAPSDFSNLQNWQTRLDLEVTKAIKCPSVLTQLSGCKKVQQILSTKEAIQQFLPTKNDQELSTLCDTFVKLYPLDNSELGKRAKKLAFEKPEQFVLKPQREGGGNNIYKENIVPFLQSLDEKDWQGYILMELIRPPASKNKIIREGRIYEEDIISELGVFGTLLFNEDSGKILSNEVSGWLLRSKFSSSNEGGVAAGFGCVDSVYLF
ncbi:BA75_04051T0 [Komagataella pastoris]|uniref:Glutathione synthetase n=1 Tax=Komagataella pastoris TaxID=4922 RepID=A0A1B2JFA8_PICPA|nr:BA75_04051T0 [Komagataella pastoris]